MRKSYTLSTVFRIQIQIHTDPHKEMLPADLDPDPGGKKAQEMYIFIR